MSHSLSFNNLIVNQLTIRYDKQQDDYILKSDSDGLVSWVSKNSMISDKQFNHYVGELFGGGIVTAVWVENGVEKCLVTALQDVSYVETTIYYQDNPPFEPTPGPNNYSIGNLVPWSNLNTICGASWSVSGASNSSIVTTQPGFDSNISPLNEVYTSFTTKSGYSGAAQYCLNYVNPDYGTGIWTDWYLPSVYELSTFFANLGIINKTLSQYAQDSGRSLIDTEDNLTYVNNIAAGINLANNSSTRDVITYFDDSTSVGYWSSTEASATEAYAYLLKSGPDGGQYSNNVAKYNKSNYLLTRPFRIADDTTPQFQFDAEYIVITYQFTDGIDLDTKTRMILPTAGVTPWNEANTYVNGTNGGPNSANFVGYSSDRPWIINNYNPYNGNTSSNAYDYTPSVTDTIPAPVGQYNSWGRGNNVAGTYSILKSAGDNVGQGYESILVDVSAFKLHFPTQQEFTIDCRAWWQNNPPSKPPGVNPVILGVTMYKGGLVIRNGSLFKWENNTYTSKYELQSYGTVVPAPSTTITPDSNDTTERVALFKYNVSTKIGQIIG